MSKNNVITMENRKFLNYFTKTKTRNLIREYDLYSMDKIKDAILHQDNYPNIEFLSIIDMAYGYRKLLIALGKIHLVEQHVPLQ